MNAITRFILSSFALSFLLVGIAAAQNTRAGVGALPRRAQLTVQRSALQGTLPVRLRCEWGNAMVALPGGGRVPINLSGFLGPRVGIDYAMYSQPFTVGDEGGVLSFYTSGGVDIRRDAIDDKLAVVGGDIVVGQMIDLVDADSGELLQGIRGTFLRFTGTSASPDSSWSYRLRVDLGRLAGRRVQLRSIASVSTGSEPCERCAGNPLPSYITYYSDAELPALTAASESVHEAPTVGVPVVRLVPPPAMLPVPAAPAPVAPIAPVPTVDGGAARPILK